VLFALTRRPVVGLDLSIVTLAHQSQQCRERLCARRAEINNFDIIVGVNDHVLVFDISIDVSSLVERRYPEYYLCKDAPSNFGLKISIILDEFTSVDACEEVAVDLDRVLLSLLEQVWFLLLLLFTIVPFKALVS
jgi:hypothetical protein